MPNSVRRILDPVEVYIKTTWTDPWVLRPNVEPIDAVLSAGNVGTMRFRVRYGDIKWPADVTTTVVPYTNIQRDWVKVQDNAGNIIFQGRIESDTRNLFGNESGTPGGVQTFTAYDGTRILQKILVGSSTINGGDEITADREIVRHVNAVNTKDNGLTAKGNRSKVKVAGYGADHYLFGGEADDDGEMWQLHEYLIYLIEEFVNTNDAVNHPVWTISGMTAALDIDGQPFAIRKRVLPVLEHIRFACNIRYGMQFVVLPTAAGFEIKVFSMVASNLTFGGYTLPANPNTFSINPTTAGDAHASVERSQVETYGKIVLYGSPAIICCTPGRGQAGAIGDKLTEAWTIELEEEYVNAENTSADVSDEFRKDPKFRDVYQTFSIKTEWPKTHCPSFNDDGSPNYIGNITLDKRNQRMLAWLPIKSGFDYSVDPPVHPDGTNINDPKWANVEWRPPFSIMEWRDVDNATIGDGDFHDGRRLGFSFFVNESDIQFTVESDVINHFATGFGIFAWGGRFFDAGHFTPDLTNEDTLFIFNIATIAFESPERIRLVYTVAGATAQDGVLYAEEPSAQFVFLAPETIVGIRGGDLVKSSSSPIILRNDIGELERVMAGLVARYVENRNLAVVRAHGLFDWGGYIGDILDTLGDGTDANTISAPVTRVRWRFERDFETTLETGFNYE